MQVELTRKFLKRVSMNAECPLCMRNIRRVGDWDLIYVKSRRGQIFCHKKCYEQVIGGKKI